MFLNYKFCIKTNKYNIIRMVVAPAEERAGRTLEQEIEKALRG